MDVAPAGAVALLDSDLVFVRDFKNSDLGNPEEQRILVRAIPKTESGKHRGHVEKSRQIFKLPAGSTEHHYMSSPNIWYTDWVNALHEYLERNYGDKWQNVLYQAGHISAYTLYGTFVDEVLNPPELIRRPKSFHEIVWDMNSYNRFISGEIGSSPEILCVVIQSNLGIPVKEYTARIEELWSRT
jgi:hypothetical protein